MEIPKREFFLNKLREAEARAAAARTPGDRILWEDVAKEYRRYLQASEKSSRPLQS